MPTVFTVTSLGDDGAGFGNAGDLRYVIRRANKLHTGTNSFPDLIQFTGVTLTPEAHTIRIGTGAAGARPLPALTDKVIIDATSAGGFNNLTGLLLTLDGSRLRRGADGLALEGGHATVRGLEIVNFPGHGIRVSSSHNTIGGTEVGFNAAGQRSTPAGRITTFPPGPMPTTLVFVRPPQGNVVSGNRRGGVILSDGANHNLLSGNFIGTDVTGTVARGNGGDGVAIINSHHNQLLGTSPPDKDNPFVFYNVISGNRGNGLVLDNSNSTKVYANFFGLGADDRTPVGNRRDGVLITGTSDRTQLGGNIPLGNVAAANGRHGIEIADRASRIVAGNNFCGVAAFNPSAQVGNGKDGVLVTSTGGNKVIRKSGFSTILLTHQCSGNGRNGIEITGRAAGVQVSQSVVGMQTNGRDPQPNGKNGIQIGGLASGVTLGGFEPSVLGRSEGGTFFTAANLISGNRHNGVAVGGRARGVTILNSRIGTDVTGTRPAANGENGIFLNGVSGVRIGSRRGANNPNHQVVIGFNTGAGVRVQAGADNSILGNSIFNNGALGIDLKAGGNGNQPAPRLTLAHLGSGGAILVTGTLKAQPRTRYQVEIFASQSAQPGNGQVLLGIIKVKTNAAGRARFAVSGLTNPDPTATFFTATATSPQGNTSKFSQAIRAS